ncbi:MAG: FYVE zinc finger domain-containing protein, partial [Candidatus Thorarchaeota archaeon]
VYEGNNLAEEKKVLTIFDRPAGLRFIGLLQMAFGTVGMLATAGLLMATISGTPELAGGLGYIYTLLVFVGVTIPCLVIGNYVDDLRKSAAIAQVAYSLLAMGLTGLFLALWGTGYVWGVPLFDFEDELILEIGNLAVIIFISQAFIILYLILNWHKVVPPDGAKVIRNRTEAKLYEEGMVPSPLAPILLDEDGTELSDDESKRIMDIRKVVTEEGIAVLCSNCNGATPLSNAKDNKLTCGYCGVTLGVGNVFVPCENHAEYLAATTCAVCGHHFCRKCLTAQKPPIDKRWKGSTVFMCKPCFEGRYRPAVTTTSFVIPIDKLFATAGARFSTVGRIYRRFLGAYGGVLKAMFTWPLALIGSLGKKDRDKEKRRGGGGWGGGGGSIDLSGLGGSSGDCDACAGAILLIVIIIIAIPIIAGILLTIGAIIFIPLLFYAGLIAVTIEALKVISRTDFQSLDNVRIQSVIEKKQPKVKQSTLRPYTRTWEEDVFAKSRQRRAEERKREEEQRRRRGQRTSAESFWGGGTGQ